MVGTKTKLLLVIMVGGGTPVLGKGMTCVGIAPERMEARVR